MAAVGKPAASLGTSYAQLNVAPSSGPARYWVQLSSVRTAERARWEWKRLQRAYPDLLKDMNLTIQQIELGERGTFHRVQTGEFNQAPVARTLCAVLKADNQDCLVVRR